MTIKFSCPECKNVLSVDEKLAGKNAKCPKCAGALRIPVPKATKVAASSPSSSSSSPGMASALAELTESDFNRKSPFETVYTPPKAPPISSEILRRAAGKEDEKPVKSGGGPPVVQVIYAVLNFLEALVLLAVAGVLFFAKDWVIENARNQNSSVEINLPDATLPVVLVSIYAIVLIALAIGLLQKRLWGYIFATTIYVLFSSVYFSQLLFNLTNRRQLVGIGIAFIINAFMTSYFFRPTCLKYYGIKGWTVPLICAAAGAAPVIPIVIVLLIFLR